MAKLAFWLLATMFCAAQNGKIESRPALSDPSVSESLKAALEPAGYHLILNSGDATCDIWLRAGIGEQDRKDLPGVLYPQLAESTLLAVISFSQNTTDYRGQIIKAGIYTLRYELIPEDGHHLGVAENRDFLLLTPAAVDVNPDMGFKLEELAGLIHAITGNRHPGIMSLVQPGDGAAPAVTQEDAERWVFSAGLKLSSGEILPFAFVVKGTLPQ